MIVSDLTRKSNMRYLLQWCFVSLACVLSNGSAAPKPKVLIVSFDGFRYNYVNRTSTPNMFNLRQKSTYAEYMVNIFPTKTFPNHYSLATGVYAEDHGVIDSTFQENGVTLSYGQQMVQYNKDVVPIWIHNQNRGGVSGVMMWFGGELKYQNKQAKFYKVLNKDTRWEEKITIIIDWFNDKKTPANLVMIYFNQPDESAHNFGSDSAQVRRQIDNVDEITKYLDNKLKENNLDVNVFLLSDHGMSDVPFNNIIDLTSKTNTGLEQIQDFYTTIGSSPVLQVIPTVNKENDVYNAFHQISKKNGHFTVYRKADLPAEWHYRNNSRVAKIVIVANLGYCFHDILEWNKPVPTPGTVIGLHGYDNKFVDMRPFFMSWGPQIKRNFKIRPFDTVDLFSLWCKILKIEEIPNRGNFKNVKEMLFNENGVSLSPVINPKKKPNE